MCFMPLLFQYKKFEKLSFDTFGSLSIASKTVTSKMVLQQAGASLNVKIQETFACNISKGQMTFSKESNYHITISMSVNIDTYANVSMCR